VKLFKSYNKKKCILKAKAIICVSENTKKDLMKFIPNIDISKIYVVYNGKSEIFKVDDTPLELIFKEIKKNEFILFVGQRKGYKNFMTLVDAIVLYKTKKLVIVGGGNLTRVEKKYLDSVLGDKNYIHYLGIDNKSLNVLYNNAYCFVYPSLYEGFGIPVIEAQSAGCPVIAVNTSSLSEILGDSAILLNSVSPKTIMDALFSLEDQYLKEHLISLGLKNAEKYSWDIMSKSYLKIYQDIWNKYNTIM
jgi:mannosyltransferase